MKILSVLTLAAAAGAGLAGSALAATAVATTDLNLRAGPGPQYPIVSSIAGNGSVEVIGCMSSGRWCDVSYNGVRGWAYADYLTLDAGGSGVSIADATAQAKIPAADYSTQAYWDQNYRNQSFYAQRDRYVTAETTGSTAKSGGAVTGAAGGAVAGALVGGPIGAAIGGIAGATLGAAVTPPDRVNQYVTSQAGSPVMLGGEVVVGGQLPSEVQLAPVPQYDYSYAYVNGQRVLVDPSSRRIVYVYR